MCDDNSSPKVRCGGVFRNTVFKVKYEIECPEGFVNNEAGELISGKLDDTNLISSKYVKIECNGDGTGVPDKKCRPITCPLFTESLPENAVLLADSVFLAVHARKLQEIPIKEASFKYGPYNEETIANRVYDGNKTGSSDQTHSKTESDMTE